tara:strand:+ start:571 stop:3621 length:3051 start_codon:yes stop_codon:yes gene_type:complete
MVAPFVLPAIPIITAIGRFAAPYLVKELGKIGANKFVKTYGDEAFTSLNETLANNTPMVNAEAMPMVNPNFMSKKDEEDKTPTVVSEDEIKQPQKQPPEDPDLGTKLAAEAALQVSKKLSESEQTEKLITGTKDLDVLPEATKTVLEAEKAIKQTKKLKENKKIEDYFDSLDELYDNEWYGTTKNIKNFFGSQDPDDIPYSYEEMFFQEYGQTKPIHELFENEYQGGVGDLGNADAAKVMAGGGMFRYGEFYAPEYYQEYQEKLVEYTRKKLGDEFIGYRLTRKEEMDKYLNVDRSMTGEEEFYTKARSYSLSRSTAEGFKYLWSDYFTNADGSPREDLILIETPIEAESLLMRGKSVEKEVVVSGSYLDSDKMNFYDLKGNLLQKAIKGPLAKKQTEALLEPKVEFGPLTETEKQTAKALKEGKPDFYSRAVDAIKNAKQNKFTKGKWKSIVQSNSTKEEMKYLGLDKYLQGNESITKEELLKFVEKKDIAPNITVRSIPKDEMNTMYEGYSLGFAKEGTQEHIVFQFGRDKVIKDVVTDVPYSKEGTEFTPLFKSEHFDTEYGTNTFAHARVQVGFGDPDAPPADYEMSSETIKKFDNTLIIDEIQSDYIQRGQDKGFVSDYDIIPGDKLVDYFKKHNISYRIYDKKDMEPGEQGESPHYQFHKSIEFKQTGGEGIKPGDAPGIGPMDPDVKYIFRKSDNTEFTRWRPEEYEEDAKYSSANEFLQKAYGKVPDFPIKESKKFVELVLNKMIEKAVLDGRDSIAITNGQIQANRYDAMGKEEKQGLKKFYDEIVFKQLEKISDKYNVKLETIDISEGEAPKELQDIHLDNQIKKAQDDGYKLEKVSLQFLFDRTMDTDIPGHASIYSDRGVGQGRNYIEDYLRELVDNRPFSPATGTGSGLDKWNEIRNNEVYIWIKEQDISRDRIGWELPIVPVIDAYNTIAGTPETQQRLETLSDQDIEVYTQYLKGIEPPKGEEIGPEQLIKMKLPKKLQKERLSKPIKLTKAKTQTDRLFT